MFPPTHPQLLNSLENPFLLLQVQPELLWEASLNLTLSTALQTELNLF